MRKFIVYILICIFLLIICTYKEQDDFVIYNNLSVQIFTNYSDDEWMKEYSTVSNGCGKIIFCDYDGYKKFKKNNAVSGVTFIFDGNAEVFQKFQKEFGVKFVEKTETSFVGYSKKFCSSVLYKNKKVNIQGYISNNKVYIGTPLLLGSY